MKIIDPGFEIITPVPGIPFDGMAILKRIEAIGRVCYKSEERITHESAPKFVAMLIKRGHEAMLEHYAVSVRFVCDRGVSHEIVRHRVASFAQESTRYCNYSKEQFGEEITVIKPLFFSENARATFDSAMTRHATAYEIWKKGCENAEADYFRLLDGGATPQEARSVLPNSLKTEIVMTANLREWRHFFKLRCAPTAHPQMREVTVPLLLEMKRLIPVVFDDITF